MTNVANTISAIVTITIGIIVCHAAWAQTRQVCRHWYHHAIANTKDHTHHHTTITTITTINTMDIVPGITRFPRSTP
jgi:hypothetical protein